MVLKKKIIVDADACPRNALQICQKVGEEDSLQVVTVASFEHDIGGEEHFVVGNDPQETDIKIANLIRPGDIAVTADLGLAALLIGKGAFCISPKGKVFSEVNIDFLLEERNIKQKFRRSGGRTKGPAKRIDADDEVFERKLRGLVKKEEK